MDKALVFGTKDCRFESCQGHLCKALVCPLLLGQEVKALGAAATIGISHKKGVEHGQAVSMQFCPLGRNMDQMTSKSAARSEGIAGLSPLFSLAGGGRRRLESGWPAPQANCLDYDHVA